MFEELDAEGSKMTALTFFNTKTGGASGSGAGPDGSEGGRVISDDARSHRDFTDNRQYFSWQDGDGSDQAYLVNTLIQRGPDMGIRWGFSWSALDVSQSRTALSGHTLWIC
jgi:hypothetical protein